jgi:transcriptional regulator with XRE-family HTH domain
MVDSEPKVPGPAIVEEVLRNQLVGWRADAGLIQADVSRYLDMATSTVSRVETGERSILAPGMKIKAMLGLYGVSEADREAALQKLSVLQVAQAQPLTPDYKAVSKSQHNYVQYEAYADRIRAFGLLLVPDILQTQEYATGLVGSVYQDTARLKAWQRIRQERAERILGPDGPPLRIMIGETALHAAVGGLGLPEHQRYDPMIRMLDRLKTANTVGRSLCNEAVEQDRNPHVSIQVVPLKYGTHQLQKHYTINHFEFDDPQVGRRAYAEMDGDKVVVADDIGAQFVRLFDDLSGAIPGPEHTATMLDAIQQGYGKQWPA